MAKVLKIEPVHVVDFLKLAVLSIDGTLGYGGEYIVYNPDHVVLNMRRCEVLQKYTDEGLQFAGQPDRIALRATHLGSPSSRCKPAINLPPKDFKFGLLRTVLRGRTRGREPRRRCGRPRSSCHAMERILLMDVTVSK